jgi:magnesium chelatase subunit D
VSDALADADRAAALFAIDPAGFGGICLRAPQSAWRDAWLAALRTLLPAGCSFRKLPLGIDEGRLVGGIDLGATLRAGRPIAARGLLAESDGGVLVVPMAERIRADTAGHLAASLDSGTVRAERDGQSLVQPARIGLIALDEGIGEEEVPPAILLERLAFLVEAPSPGVTPSTFTAADVAAARALYPAVVLDDAMLQDIGRVSLALGIGSLRVLRFAACAARAAAALAGAPTVEPDHAEIAMRLVLVPRAMQLPESLDQESEVEPQPPQEPQNSSDDSPSNQTADLEAMSVASAAAQLPAGLLDRLFAREKALRHPGRTGRSGQQSLGGGRGRPAGVLRGVPGRDARFNVIATLQAAAPWQKLRRGDGDASNRIRILRDDWRVTRLKRRRESATVFVVDASGSAALHRLGEAKGAVELMLADCYIRRDRVALIAFRGATAELTLPPTRSLARARRSLAGLPGGGGTPLATALDAAGEIAGGLRGKGQTPLVVLLTDGRANVTRDGRGDRAQAESDALAAARRHRATEIPTVVIDTAPRAGEAARRLAAEAGARYIALPHADAAAISRAVQMQRAAAP